MLVDLGFSICKGWFCTMARLLYPVLQTEQPATSNRQCALSSSHQAIYHRLTDRVQRPRAVVLQSSAAAAAAAVFSVHIPNEPCAHFSDIDAVQNSL